MVLRMKPPYTIGRLARLAGVPTSTVRFYERSHLLRPEGRTAGNYRLYGQAALERLRFIIAAKANGFTLEDVTALLDFRDGRTGPCQEVQTLLQERLSALDTRLEQLHEVRGVLRTSLERCRETEPSGRCQVIENLTVASSASPRRTADPPQDEKA